MSTKSALPTQPSSNSYVTSIRGDSNSAVFDAGATSRCGRICDKFQPTTQKSHKIFHMPNGETTAAGTQAKLYHNVCEPEKKPGYGPGTKTQLTK